MAGGVMEAGSGINGSDSRWAEWDTADLAPWDGAMSPSGVAEFRLDMVNGMRELATISPSIEERQLLTDGSRLLAEASLHWFGAEVVDLALHTWADVPIEVTAPAAVLPGESGVVVFADPIVLPASNLEVQGVRWEPQTVRRQSDGKATKSDPNNPATFSVSCTLISRMTAAVDMVSLSWVPPGVVQWWEKGDGHDPRVDAVVKIMTALFGLANSPGITRAEISKPDRPTRRRAQRAGVTDDSATRVVYLNGSAAHERTGTSGEYRHRWIVRGHWRSQPYGPRRSMRRAVYISPHVKGPEGAPLLTGDKVYALVNTPTTTTDKDNNQ
jgi:hypothetical protein